MTFVDLTKAFDTVSREGLCKIMAKFGCPAKFIAMVRQFHDGMLARVQNDGEFSDPFPVTNGIKQGLSKALFSMMFLPCLQMLSRMVTMVYLLGNALMGNFSTLRGLQAKSKVQTEVLDELLMTWQRVLQQKRKGKKVWIKYLIHVKAMISQAASKRLR